MRIAQEREFTTHDGSTLFYRYWPPAGAAAADRAVVLFHRGHEHSGRLQHVVDELGLDGFAMFAWDARGHGRSPGARGDSPSFGALVKDVDSFIRHISHTHGIASTHLAVIGQSVGAVLAATWAHDYAPRIRCLVLTAPAFKVKLYVPLARSGLALISRLFGNFFITSYVKPKFLTHDPDRIRSYGEDPLVTKAISARVLLGLYDAADRLLADAQAIRLPLQLLISEKDWVVHRGPQDAFFDRLGSPVKERHLLAGFLHDTLGERDRQLAIDKIRDFIERTFSTPPAVDSLLNAHRSGYTRDEEIRLGEPLPALSLRKMNFALTRLSMRSLGRLSAGIRIGLATGFDSGSSLDYVYRNQASGALLVGKLIDRGYLDALGWRGIRVRREHLIQAIVAAAQELRVAGQAVRIADIAAGHGRYVLDSVERLPEQPQSILLRDYSELNVRQGRALIADRRLTDIARFELGDAFDEGALASLSPRPNLAIVSGLYELFSDNELVARSLRGVARAVDTDGYLVYTGQPWHPQIEMIARTLTSHRNQQAWVMRRRTQAEMDELVRAAGFTKIEQWVDEWGMFTVSLARRD
ncbi:putative hydrolase [Candidatus Accumulibacter aalborgensis]|uniref:Putative hydrolase n=1 Tax=Candidatus Accumulibacter aalborgensis TaxID=1860102 RepID=A0A1A8XJB1_9PROT|nr:bifunctional alpha/beta hydrolase/class I SAM-dependent methyltransferase [Candidatus Accumulibacter aalborgensis]SBT05274.1 putative hydrolase [Candidatus Accumulibacter aalborgensis]